MEKLTRCQEAVLKLLCKQYSSREIADELHISVKTVHRHRQDLLDRTGSKNLAGLVIYAIKQGLVSVDTSCQFRDIKKELP